MCRTALDNSQDRRWINCQTQAEAAGDADDDQPAVSLHTRAVPLVRITAGGGRADEDLCPLGVVLLIVVTMQFAGGLIEQ